jgi:hypothetical protein
LIAGERKSIGRSGSATTTLKFGACDHHQVTQKALHALTCYFQWCNFPKARKGTAQRCAARLTAFDIKRSLEPNNPDGSLAMQNAGYQVELAARDFREALREFVSAFDAPAE